MIQMDVYKLAHELAICEHPFDVVEKMARLEHTSGKGTPYELPVSRCIRCGATKTATGVWTRVFLVGQLVDAFTSEVDPVKTAVDHATRALEPEFKSILDRSRVRLVESVRAMQTSFDAVAEIASRQLDVAERRSK